MELFVILPVGILLLVLGVVGLLGKNPTVNRQTKSNIREGDARAYSRVMGVGCLLVGADICLCTLLEWVLGRAELVGVLMPAGLVIGFVIIGYARVRYGKG